MPIHRAAVQDDAVHLAVQGHAAGQAQRAAAGLRHGAARQAHRDLFQAILHSPGDVLLPRRDLIAVLERQSQLMHQFVGVAIAVGMLAEEEVAGINAIRAVGRERRHAVEDRGDLRIVGAVAGQAHHAAFIGIGTKAQELGQAGVHPARGVRDVEALDLRDLHPLAVPDHRALLFAAGVNRDDRRFIVTG